MRTGFELESLIKQLSNDNKRLLAQSLIRLLAQCYDVYETTENATKNNVKNEEENAFFKIKKWIATYPNETFTQSQFTRKFQHVDAQLRSDILSELVDSGTIVFDPVASMEYGSRTRAAKAYKILKREGVSNWKRRNET